MKISLSTTRLVLSRILLVCFVVGIGYAFYSTFFASEMYTDAPWGCAIEVEPSVLYKKDEMIRAIGLIPETDPVSYQRLCEYVTAIGPTDECGSMATACAHMGTRIGFGRSNYGHLPGANSDIEGLAATIVHETCHFHQGHTRKKLEIKHKDDKSTSVREAECYGRGESFLSALHAGRQAEHASEYGIYEDYVQ